MKATADTVLKCDICGKTFKGKRAPQAKGGHMRSHYNNGTAPPSPRTRKRQDFLADLELVPVVQRCFPKGIQTDDPVLLVRDLKLIADLRERFVR